MALTDPELWNRLMAFQYDTPGAGGLVARVMDALGLSKAKAQGRVDAYLRFIYLVAVSDEVLAPSKPVDEVWHLHLEDEAGYRDGFCLQFIGRVINHHEGRPSPTRDPAYRRCLTRYQEEFGTRPDARLWPAPARPVSKSVYALGAGLSGVALGYLTDFVLLYAVGFLLVFIGTMMLGKAADAGQSGCGGGWFGSDGGSDSDSGGGDGGGDGGGCGGD